MGDVMAKRSILLVALATLCLPLTGPASAQEAGATKPNILIIWGDDIGQFNVSAYNNGMMGYRTPNIDRLAEEGALFTDWYGQQSCTAGRAAFITGQSPIRTGLTKVGLPGAPEGMMVEDPTIAGLLRPLGYVTGQFGKNHLGDRDEMLPTNNGFEQFFGNLYHLNAEEEPENPDYPQSSSFKEQFGPRGVIRSSALVDGGQQIEDTGPLTRERMETVDEEVTTEALAFMDKAQADGKPFFLWWNSTRMHIFTHLKPESEGVTGLGVYADGMVEHDGQVGQLLAKLDELGIADNTIVMYSTDNGAETFTWPDGGTTMFRGEKNTNWEGGYRVPTIIRWPGVIEPGTVINDIAAHEDMLTTLARRRRRARHQARAAHRQAGRRPNLQGPPRRLRPRAGAQGRSGLAAPRVPLLDRRRQRRGAALRQLEGHLPAAERARSRGLAAAVRGAARADARQPADGSLRARRGGERHGLPALVSRPDVPDRTRRRLRRRLAAELPRVPAAAEARQLQPRARDGGGDRGLALRSLSQARRPWTPRPTAET